MNTSVGVLWRTYFSFAVLKEVSLSEASVYQSTALGCDWSFWSAKIHSVILWWKPEVKKIVFSCSSHSSKEFFCKFFSMTIFQCRQAIYLKRRVTEQPFVCFLLWKTIKAWEKAKVLKKKENQKDLTGLTSFACCRAKCAKKTHLLWTARAPVGILCPLTG